MPLLTGLGLACLGCGGGGGPGAASAAPATARTPRQLVLVYDRSTSITGGELHLYQRLTDQVLDFLDHGDRVAALEMLQLSLEEVPRRWAQRVPDREFQGSAMERDAENRRRFLRDVRDYLNAYTDREGRDNYLGTDILSTLHDVAAEVRGFPDHRTTVVLFSDMLQATPEINMEDMIRMPPPEWVAEHAAAGRLSDFSGACIVVAGARTDTVEGQRVKAFWQEYFAATGATLLEHNYAYRPVRIPQDPC
ncbi:MAG: hypothetical protein ACRD2Z_02410 [Thermoanaerobaculia bacterium]